MTIKAADHIGLKQRKVPKIMLLCGDPSRVQRICSHLTNVEAVASNREFTTAFGKIKITGTPLEELVDSLVTPELDLTVGVMSCGIGGPSTAIGIEELINRGAECFQRVGTGGGYLPHIRLQDLMISQATIRHGGTSDAYTRPLGKAFPAVADLLLTMAIVRAAQLLEHPHHLGITREIDAFYPENSPDHSLIPKDVIRMKRACQRAKVLGVSMESGTIFPICSIRGVRASETLAVVDAAGEEEHNMKLDPGEGVDRAILTNLLAIALIRHQVLQGKLSL